MITLFELNSAVERAPAAAAFKQHGRVQIRDFLTEAAARSIQHILSSETPWGLSWRAGTDGPHQLRKQELEQMGPKSGDAIARALAKAMTGKDYAFAFAQYPLLEAYLEQWQEHPGLELMLEHINSEPLLSLVREVTGIPELVKADARATLFAPNHFLSLHDDAHVAEGWRIAYVMNFCTDQWRPDWGGYLMFYDDEGDVVAGYRPRFNALNLFRVPQKHNVTYVPPFASPTRFAITGWFRDQ